MSKDELKQAIEALARQEWDDAARLRAREVCAALLDALESGELRAAEPDGDGWRAIPWVKQGILLAFRAAESKDFSINGSFQFRDRDLLGPQDWLRRHDTLRVVPGGSMLRRGSYVGENVVIMPPAYVNVGAYIGDGTMIDSHALVGSCAQVGRKVHLSAAAQLGGVLEPVGALPVIVEDDAFIGGGCGVYEGARVRQGAVLGAGVVLTPSVPLYDLANEREIRAGADGVLAVPPYAIVVPGARPAAGRFAQERGLQLQAPMIVRYRDPDENPSLALEHALR
ncbi:2,3,4,5-tetrahydropyridine-2,6-dicarboxylate N-succinyltransferase [Candidatus Sumerlaeota bacterium]|nr:2,3,4,5-tetrahydropyridine-2,6-dicarboxylate N-succinyltransferase [Candidatus Sumerlaeota bacterium]